MVKPGERLGRVLTRIETLARRDERGNFTCGRQPGIDLVGQPEINRILEGDVIFSGGIEAGLRAPPGLLAC